MKAFWGLKGLSSEFIMVFCRKRYTVVLFNLFHPIFILTNSTFTVLTIKLELKEQRTWQKRWKSTTHWQHWIWRWDLFIFETINLETNEIQHSKYNQIGVEGAKNMAEALKINNTLTTLHLLVRFVLFLKQSILKSTISLKFNIQSTIKLELKEQRTWQKRWKSTTH